jgi:DNA-binding MarR family transcriptional regulator
MNFIYQSFGFLAAKASEKLLMLLQPYLDEEHITVRQLGILILIEEQPGIKQKQVGIIQQIDRTTITQQIDLLEKAMLVKRISPPNDRRAYGLYLTKEGKSLATRLKEYIYATEKSFFKNLTEPQIADLKKLLLMLVDNGGMI